MKWFHVIPILFAGIETILCYCWQPGKNPGFHEKPRVEQIAYDKVRVSWYDLVYEMECVDQFLVKYWMASDPRTEKLTEFLPKTRFETTIEVIPRVAYEFQVVAREDKGGLLGVDYNRSPVSKFQTSRLKENVDPTVPPGFEGRIDLSESTTTIKPGLAKPRVDFHTPILIGLIFVGLSAIMTMIAVAVNYWQRTSEDD